MSVWFSPAKLNLFLYITGRRADGYHNLQTLFQFLDYGDQLRFQVNNSDDIDLLTPIAQVNKQDNLIIKAANRLYLYAKQQQRLPANFHCGVDISIDKKLPLGGGLGGGSSNAAITLMALNQLWQLDLTQAELMSIGLTLGADVPIFVYGHAAFAQGVGEQLQIAQPPEYWYLICKPPITISTADIFNSAQLKRDSVTRSYADLLSSPFSNDCEATVREAYPAVDRLLKQLACYAPARLTGTGACVFAECSTQVQAQLLQRKMAQYDPHLTLFVAQGCNDLRQLMPATTK